MSPEDIRAAAETYKEPGPGYRDAVIESFLDKVSREVDGRVDRGSRSSRLHNRPDGRGEGRSASR